MDRISDYSPVKIILKQWPSFRTTKLGNDLLSASVLNTGLNRSQTRSLGRSWTLKSLKCWPCLKTRLGLRLTCMSLWILSFLKWPSKTQSGMTSLMELETSSTNSTATSISTLISWFGVDSKLHRQKLIRKGRVNSSLIRCLRWETTSRSSWTRLIRKRVSVIWLLTQISSRRPALLPKIRIA